jgi:hypothetical protein
VQAVVSPLDSTVFSPEPAATLGQKDEAAVAELTANISVLSGGSRWVGMQGTGTITYGTDSTQNSVTLSNLGADRFRLDTQTPGGVESIRIDRRIGKIQFENGPVSVLNPDTAILGIFPFEIAQRAASPGKNVALLDRGTTSSDGRSLHRVALEMPSVIGNPATKSQKTLPVDLYFDPATHLLVKSVCYVLIPGGRQVPFLSVVTYSDYRSVGASVVPFHYSESLNGQPYRTVQLTSVQLNPTLSATYFQF